MTSSGSDVATATAFRGSEETTERDGERAALGRPKQVSLAAGGVIAQSANSLSNLAVAILVARMLGLSALGEYGFIFSLLLTFVALQTAWVGDSLVVLGRGDPVLRRGIAWTQLLFSVGGGFVGAIVLYLYGGVASSGVAAFGVLVAVWQLEEYTRRALMARLAYWRQAICDASYGLAAIGALLVVNHAGRTSLASILWCMATGACVAAAIGFIAVRPEDRLRLTELRGPLGESVAAVRQVGSFGIWRAAQTGTSQATQTLLRVLVLLIASSATLGTLEAARLVTAPLYTLLSAAMNMTLPLFTRARGSGARSLEKLARISSLLLVGSALVYGGAVLVLAGPATHLLVGADKPTNRVAIAGWIAGAVALGYSNAFAAATLASGASAEIFWLRSVGSAVVLICAACALALAHPSLVPMAIAGGTLVSAVLIRHRGRRYLSFEPGPALTGAG